MAPSTEDYTYSELSAMLEWHAAAGVDLAISETPTNQFAAQKAAKAPIQVPTQAVAAPVVAKSAPEGDPLEAAEIAKKANTLDELRDAMNAFDGCALKHRATQLVFADGDPSSSIMMIGEAPGRDEDASGKPFSGKSGDLLDLMLGSIELDRTKVYLANTVSWRPPGSRSPSPAEAQVCLPFIRRQIELATPKFLVTFGAAATQSVFGESVVITKVRGRWHEKSIGAASFKVLPMLPPDFLIRQPAQKRFAWQDLLTLKKAIQSDDD